jgi:hypothetical protein
MDEAIICDASTGPSFWDISISDECDANLHSCSRFFWHAYVNDTGLRGNTFFTGSDYFSVEEIEVFEITV